MQLMQEYVQKSTSTTWPRSPTRSRLALSGVLSQPVAPPKFAAPGRLASDAGRSDGAAGTWLLLPDSSTAVMTPATTRMAAMSSGMRTRGFSIMSSLLRGLRGSWGALDPGRCGQVREQPVGGAGEDHDAQGDEEQAAGHLDGDRGAVVAAHEARAGVG